MIIGIGQAFNGHHKEYSKALNKFGAQTFYFDIDTPNWVEKIKDKKADAYLWHADAKDENYRIIHDRIYFLEHVLKKKIFPDMNMYFSYNDKAKQLEYFKYFKIPTIKTWMFNKYDPANNFIDKTEYPLVIKNVNSYGGKGVYLIKNKTQAKKIIEQIFKSKNGYHKIKDYLYAQEYINGLEKDLRIITIGNKVKFAYWRINNQDWKHNVGRGGQIDSNNIPQSAIKLCEKISKQQKFHWMAYDVFMLKNKPIILEFACNFSTKGIEKHGFDVRKELMRYLHNKLK